MSAYKPVPATAAHTPPVSVDAHDEGWLKTDAERRLSAAVTEALGAGHTAETRAVRGGRRSVLVRASADADLLVLDAPRTVLRSGDQISLRRLVSAARCPVVVMPLSVEGSQPSWLARLGRALGSGALRAAGTAGRPGRPPVGR